MPTTYAIPDSRTVMAATLYTGNGSTQTISNSNNGVSFQPDFVWIKNRSSTYSNYVFDSVRGLPLMVYTNGTAAETSYNTISSLNSNGFTVITTGGSGTNANAETFVGWQWKAGGTAVSNTAGSITSTVSANTTAGFSVVTYTGNGTTGATVGHGLGVTPSMVILKSRSGVENWAVWQNTLASQSYFLNLNTTDAVLTTFTNRWTAFSSTTITLGNNSQTNANAATYVAYCFASVAGYSAFGSYTGNGSTDGPFIYTGFRPRFFMYKITNTAGSWVILDSSRNPSNVTTQYLYPNASDAEAAATFVDFVSNGIKFRTTYADTNGSGNTYVYACFAENPFKFSNAR